MWPTQAEKRRPRLEPETAFGRTVAGDLLADFVDPFPGGVLGRLDLLSPLAAQVC
jgi:hypothetical protein